jgi:energy-coupling factor transporter ATP-binding protein EcfA2
MAVDRHGGDKRASPPKGHDWGERTQQGYEIRKDHRAPGYYESDAYEIRKRFGIPEFDHTEFEREEGKIASMVYPDLLIHEWETDLTTRAKGTTVIARGKRGSGKTTLRDHVGGRLIGVNDEIVVVRGRQNSSDWRRFAPWTTLYLPSGVDISIEWKYQTDRPVPSPEELVRDVVYYDDVMDLLRTLEDRPRGTYNVVYPDPEHRGCNDIIDRASSVPYHIEFTPQSAATGDSEPTPVSHWWFAFMLARTEFGKVRDADGDPMWMTLMIDEIGELAPENPPGGEDGHYTWEAVQMLASMMIDVRSAGLSIFGNCHYWSDIATPWRKQFNYRISMPDGRQNPVKQRSSTHPKGWESVPMNHDLISDKNPGTGLCYSESRFTYFSWDELAVPEAEQLPPFRLDLGAQESVKQPEFWFEDALLASFQTPMGDVELRVKDGSGVIDCSGPEVVEPLAVPTTDSFEGVSFVGLREGARSSVLVIRTPTGEREVAEIPHNLNAEGAVAGSGGVAGE